ncbi:hypothetical protein HARCEL1_01155 [Halococcoides cellulosivorans]|uniref:DUF7096 domain-containing protein n=2 Tax=Halococcoides cellulosivorans TaxID=1679096 RepID=A0A2R4X453_9EURY|nr:hypothetical protein HARCEL1_01155 [Halococcoides cellulosivorans]
MAQTETNTTNASENATVEPGARLAGVVGMQDAEIDGIVDRRAFGLRVAAAASDDARARAVADQTDRIGERVDALEQRKAALERARENGSISDSRYSAQMAELSSELDATRNLANDTNETAAGLPEETLEANGVNATAIQMLKDRADNMTGPEVAAIARTIGGPPENVGPPAWAGPSGERGPPAAADRGGTESGERGPTNMTDGERGPPGDRGPSGDESTDATDTATDGSESAAENGSESGL